MMGNASSKKDSLKHNSKPAAIRATKISINVDKQKLFVHGFIRKYCVSSTMPNVLKDLCFTFYFIACDAWNMDDSNKDFQVDEKNILSVKADKQNRFRTAFGTVVISKNEMFIWEFQIIAECMTRYNDRNVMIGIINIKEANRDKHNGGSYFCDNRRGGYGYYAYDGERFHPPHSRDKYGKPAKRFDIITMTLDLTNEKGILSFMVNDEDQGILKDDINVNCDYCMAISSYRSWEQIKLITNGDYVQDIEGDENV